MAAGLDGSDGGAVGRFASARAPAPAAVIYCSTCGRPLGDVPPGERSSSHEGDLVPAERRSDWRGVQLSAAERSLIIACVVLVNTVTAVVATILR